jgi:RNA polymerase sigma factor (sigma-70 family)
MGFISPSKLTLMEEVFSKVLKDQSNGLHVYFFSRLTSCNEDRAQTAEDLVQDTAKLAYPYRDDPKWTNRLKNLIWTAARTAWSRYWRRYKSKFDFGSIEEQIGKDEPQDPLQPFIDKDRLERLYETMDPTTRRICQLYCEGYKNKEIARMLSLPVGTIKMRLQRLK